MLELAHVLKENDLPHGVIELLFTVAEDQIRLGGLADSVEAANVYPVAAPTKVANWMTYRFDSEPPVVSKLDPGATPVMYLAVRSDRPIRIEVDFRAPVAHHEVVVRPRADLSGELLDHRAQVGVHVDLQRFQRGRLSHGQPAAVDVGALGERGGPRVLVAEDDASVRGLVERALASSYSVETVSDGKAALARLAATPAPDLLICDVMMPGVDGFQVARWARASMRAPVRTVTATTT